MNVNQFIAAGLKKIEIRKANDEVIVAYGAVSLSGDPQSTSIDIKGDDVELGKFVTGLSETLSLELSGLSFDVIQAITGNAVSSSATGSSVGLGTDSEMNSPIIEISAYSMAKSQDGTASVMRKTWHKVQLGTPKLEQQGENAFTFAADGTAYQTDVDVTGTSLATTRIATLNGYSGVI